MTNIQRLEQNIEDIRAQMKLIAPVSKESQALFLDSLLRAFEELGND